MTSDSPHLTEFLFLRHKSSGLRIFDDMGQVSRDDDTYGLFQWIKLDTPEAAQIREKFKGRERLKETVYLDLALIQAQLQEARDLIPTKEIHLTPKQAYAVLVALLACPGDFLIEQGVFDSYLDLAATVGNWPEEFSQLPESFKQRLYRHFTKPMDESITDDDIPEPSEDPFI
jgi:hypothetical protein